MLGVVRANGSGAIAGGGEVNVGVAGIAVGVGVWVGIVFGLIRFDFDGVEDESPAGVGWRGDVGIVGELDVLVVSEGEVVDAEGYPSGFSVVRDGSFMEDTGCHHRVLRGVDDVSDVRFDIGADGVFTGFCDVESPGSDGVILTGGIDVSVEEVVVVAVGGELRPDDV